MASIAVMRSAEEVSTVGRHVCRIRSSEGRWDDEFSVHPACSHALSSCPSKGGGLLNGEACKEIGPRMAIEQEFPGPAKTDLGRSCCRSSPEG